MQNKISEKRSNGQSAQESKEAATQNISISIDQALRLALHDFQAGNILQAEQLCRQILHLDVDNAEANHLLGNIAVQKGEKIDMAAHYIKKAIQRNPQNVNFHYSLGNILNNAGRLDEAIVCFKNTIAIKPDFAEVHNNLGNVFNKLGKHEESIASYRKSLSLNPNLPMAHFNLGSLLQKTDRVDEAMKCYRKALSLNPNIKEAHMNLGNQLHKLKRFKESAACHRKALSLDPEYAEAHFNYGLAVYEMGRTDEAISSYRKALALKPEFPQALNSLGAALRDLGMMDEATDCFKKAITAKPDFSPPYKNLAIITKFTETDKFVHSMEELFLSNETAMEDKMNLGFGLGKVFEDLQDYSKSFEYIHEANRLKRESYEYKIQTDREYFTRTKEVFTPAFFSSHHDSGNKETMPIFILGMPRSGSTLVEQILSSHPQVFGADELKLLANLINKYFPRGKTGPYPECLSGLDKDVFYRIGTEYIDHIRKLSKEAGYIINKMPHNFLHVGLIKMILPNAKVIHSMRNPMDICFSIFKKEFKGTHNYAYDMSELGLYYNLYRDLMDHWEKVLPGFMLSLEYEEMVADQENQTKRLLEFCGLSWDEACLDFHKTERKVKTASLLQVRQPIYKGSVERWKRYETQLEPLHKAIYG